MSTKALSADVKELLSNAETGMKKPALRKFSEAVAAMIHARSVNTSLIYNALPNAPEGAEEREQWLSRLLKSNSFTESQVIAPFAKKDLTEAVETGGKVVLCMDQTELGSKHAILMLALRFRNRALPLCWKVEAGTANLGATEQIGLLEQVLPWLPQGCKPIFMADRFYPSERLLKWLEKNNFSWRIRLKGNAELVCSDGKVSKVSDLQKMKYREFFDSRATLFASGIPVSIGWVWDDGHKEGWAICMDCHPDRETTMEYSKRWGIETMFSDFKSRGFDLESSQLKFPEKLSKLILMMAIAFKCCQAANDEVLKKRDALA